MYGALELPMIELYGSFSSMISMMCGAFAGAVAASPSERDAADFTQAGTGAGAALVDWDVRPLVLAAAGIPVANGPAKMSMSAPRTPRDALMARLSRRAWLPLTSIPILTYPSYPRTGSGRRAR